jgi:hypothetical protein
MINMIYDSYHEYEVLLANFTQEYLDLISDNDYKDIMSLHLLGLVHFGLPYELKCKWSSKEIVLRLTKGVWCELNLIDYLDQTVKLYIINCLSLPRFNLAKKQMGDLLGREIKIFIDRIFSCNFRKFGILIPNHQFLDMMLVVSMILSDDLLKPIIDLVNN